MADNLLSSKKAAELLNVKPQSLAAWRCSGRHQELKFVRFGRAIKYRAEDIQAFIAANIVGEAEV